MNKISKFIYYLTHKPSDLAIILLNRLSPLFSDRTYIRCLYRLNIGRWPDLDNPKTFNEKLQWLKLYNRKPEYTIMADKVKAKEWVAELIGQEHIIPTLGVWDDPDDIDFDSLPDQFVLKCNHNSGTGMYICKDKSKIDVEAVKKGLRKGLKENYFLHGREWPYKNIPRKILAEKFMVDESGMDLKDYKIFTFDGVPHFIEVDYDRFICHKRNVYDIDWRYIEMEIEFPTDNKHQIKKPKHLDELLQMAQILAQGTPHLRVDFYVINEQVYFGEMTFFHGSGHEKFIPEEWNDKFGELIHIK